MARSGSTALSVLKEIPIKEISLDIDNPRYFEDKLEFNIKKWTDKILEQHILTGKSKEQGIADILPSIKAVGIRIPIWVYENKNGKYVVLEGNRRLIVLRELIRQKISPPKGVKYDRVIAHVFPKNTDPRIVESQKLLIQTGQKKWGAFNEASQIYNLIHKFSYSPEEVAVMWKTNVANIVKEVESFKYFKEYSEFIKKNPYAVSDPRKYTYFQRAGVAVKNRFFGTKAERMKYYKMISPDKNGITKIPKVSLKGGLFDFAKFVENEKILRKFMKSPRMTVDDALLEFKGDSIKDALPWTKKLKDVSSGLNRLTKEEERKIRKDKTIYNLIKKIYLATELLVKQ